MIKFGTDGWRDIVAGGFTLENLRSVTRGVAGYLKTVSDAPKLIVGYDARFMGREFAGAVAQTAAAAGVRTIVGDEPYPTPAVAYAVRAFKTNGAIMLTASHNPYYYNGLKFIPEYSGPATEEITRAIEEKITGDDISRDDNGSPEYEAGTAGFIEYRDISREYMKALEEFLDVKKLKESGLKVGLDPYYGAGRRLFPELAGAIGLTTSVIHDNEDPLFGGTPPDPSEKNLKELKSLVLEQGLDAGFALDGDADRFGVIAENGAYLTPNNVVAMLFWHMVTNRHAGGIVVRTVATTHMIDAIAGELGIDVVETPVGFKHIGKLMREESVIIGGEESGGLSVLGHIPEKDGLLANMLVAEMIAIEKKPLSDIWRSLVNRFGDYRSIRLDIEYPDDKKSALISRLRDNPPADVGGLTVKSVNAADGAKLLLDNDAWLLVRASGTEPLVRAYIETKSQSDMKAIETAAREILQP